MHLSNSETPSTRPTLGKGMIAAVIAAVVIPFALVVALMTRQSHDTFSFTIANGTRAALDMGQVPASQLPTQLSVRVGDTLEVTNNDVVTHTYTFLVLKPGETGRYTFRNSGSFTASCTVGEHSSVTINVKE